MEGQYQRTANNRRRKKRKKQEAKPKAEPTMIVARRPDSPRMQKVSNRSIAASAQPKRERGVTAAADVELPRRTEEKPRRVARIVQTKVTELDDDQMRSQRLIERLLLSEGRLAISRAADALEECGVAVPEEQNAQLQLLEHVDELRARKAIEVMARLLEFSSPIKRPILDQRLRRLEDEAEDETTRTRAAALRRTLRVA